MRDSGDTQRCNRGHCAIPPGLYIHARNRCGPLLVHFPKLYRLVVCRKKEVRRASALAPSDLADLLLNLKGLEVVKLGLVALEFRVKAVLNGQGRTRRRMCTSSVHDLVLGRIDSGATPRATTLYRMGEERVLKEHTPLATLKYLASVGALKYYNAATLVSCCQEVPGIVKLHSREDVCVRELLVRVLFSKALQRTRRESFTRGSYKAGVLISLPGQISMFSFLSPPRVTPSLENCGKGVHELKVDYERADNALNRPEWKGNAIAMLP